MTLFWKKVSASVATEKNRTASSKISLESLWKMQLNKPWHAILRPQHHMLLRQIPKWKSKIGDNQCFFVIRWSKSWFCCCLWIFRSLSIQKINFIIKDELLMLKRWRRPILRYSHAEQVKLIKMGLPVIVDDSLSLTMTWSWWKIVIFKIYPKFIFRIIWMDIGIFVQKYSEFIKNDTKQPRNNFKLNLKPYCHIEQHLGHWFG